MPRLVSKSLASRAFTSSARNGAFRFRVLSVQSLPEAAARDEGGNAYVERNALTHRNCLCKDTSRAVAQDTSNEAKDHLLGCNVSQPRVTKENVSSLWPLVLGPQAQHKVCEALGRKKARRQNRQGMDSYA